LLQVSGSDIHEIIAAMKSIHLQGRVTQFKGNGRKLGYPTANIRSHTSARDGVYFARAWLGEFEQHPAIVFVGTPTTVGDTERRVEAHLFDVPDLDYYGQEITLELERFFRPNETFASVEELMQAMKKDEAAAREWYS
jgi:riboflavin kinase/FMN adenylyltransferase